MRFNKYQIIVFSTSIFILLAGGNSCNRNDLERVMAVKTLEVKNITSTSAVVVGEIIDTGEGMTDHGFKFSTHSDTRKGTIVSKGKPAKEGNFSSEITGLKHQVTYYACAYGYDGVTYSYGKNISFTTLSGIAYLITSDISRITATRAVCGGNIESDQGFPVTARGVCWGTSHNPTVNNSKTEDGTGTGLFTSNLSDLSIETFYYIRAYATNSAGTVYGDEKSFTTLSGLATVTTLDITSVTSNSAQSGGNVSDDGGYSVINRGVCWGTEPNPTISNYHTADGEGTGAFYSNITGLYAGATYYVCAFATNTNGTAYGNQVSFQTTSDLPTVETTFVTNIQVNSASSGGTVTSDGGSSIFSRGVCWSTSPNPTISSSKTVDGSGTGSFTSIMEGLSSNTTYFVRAYAVNISGTAYGNELNFTTLIGDGAVGTVKDIEDTSYPTIYIGGDWWMAKNLQTATFNDGSDIDNVTDNSTWAYLTSSAYCWYDNYSVNGSIYGALYNWYAVSTDKLCPSGWHVPSDAEWTALSDYLGGSFIAGGKMKESGTSHWSSPNNNATNSSGFTGLPGGERGGTDGWFGNIGDYGFWWSSTESSSDNRYAYYYRLYFYDGNLTHWNNSFKKEGFSIRCIKD